MNNLKKTVQALTIGGILPFLLLAVSSILLKEHTVSFQRAFSIYSTAIVCFVAGSQWGLLLKKTTLSFILTQTNLITLISICGLFINPLGSNIINIICFLWLLYLERLLFLNQITAPWYFYLRKNTTITVVLIISAKILQGLI